MTCYKTNFFGLFVLGVHETGLCRSLNLMRMLCQTKHTLTDDLELLCSWSKIKLKCPISDACFVDLEVCFRLNFFLHEQLKKRHVWIWFWVFHCAYESWILDLVCKKSPLKSAQHLSHSQCFQTPSAWRLSLPPWQEPHAWCVLFVQEPNA